MNYGELFDAVAVLTDREESKPLIQYAIARATLKFHASDLFNRDIREGIAPLVTTYAPRYTINTRLYLEGFRKVAYLKGYDLANNSVISEFEENLPFKTGDSYGYLKDNVYYLAGDQITIRSTQAVSYALIGWYAVPDVSPEKFQSWIADLCPWALIDEASAEIFGSIGDADEAARRRAMFEPNLQKVRVQDIEAAGR